MINAYRKPEDHPTGNTVGNKPQTQQATRATAATYIREAKTTRNGHRTINISRATQTTTHMKYERRKPLEKKKGPGRLMLF